MTKKVDTPLARRRRTLRAKHNSAPGKPATKVSKATQIIDLQHTIASLSGKLSDATAAIDSLGKQRDEARQSATAFHLLLSSPSTFRVRHALGARVFVENSGATFSRAGKGFAPGVVVGVSIDRDGTHYDVKLELEGYPQRYEQNRVHARSDEINPFGHNPAFEVPGEKHIVEQFARTEQPFGGKWKAVAAEQANEINKAT